MLQWFSGFSDEQKNILIQRIMVSRTRPYNAQYVYIVLIVWEHSLKYYISVLYRYLRYNIVRNYVKSKLSFWSSNKWGHY